MVGPSPSPPELWSLAWLDQLAPLIQAAVVVVTGVVAVRGLSAWRHQMVGKRKAELAEQVLTNFYAARDVFIEVRRRGFLSGEGKSRKSNDDESNQVQLMRNTYFIAIERLVRQGELFPRLHAQRYLFRAYFGKSTKPFETIFEANNKIITSASILMDIAQYEDQSSLDRDSLLNEIGWGKRARPDEIDRAIDAAVSEIEVFCKPILEGRQS
jgi:hypothetical protein